MYLPSSALVLDKDLIVLHWNVTPNHVSCARGGERSTSGSDLACQRVSECMLGMAGDAEVVPFRQVTG